ncbi:hypothetical protein B1H19_19090 [Streptomyces gilvosporeus]|uniref:Uncharacterized protein n=2 Tax=Streptomyces gilvosporeus TaxID=553510 RepID=A0A1V0TTJ9_9ACTN|nr:hypothetical protein B1H19_19090 [Streptomyces gilvosporeus]
MAESRYAQGFREYGGKVSPDPELIDIVDADNSAALRRIMSEHGWPAPSLVGEQASDAALLLTLRSQPDVQIQALGVIGDAVGRGEANPQHLAYLTDRILLRLETPQLYGTHYVDRHDGRGFTRWDVIDPDTLNTRRAEVGLGPLADYDTAARTHN